MPNVLPVQYRLFIAIVLPSEVKERMKEAQAELRRAVPKAHIGWTRIEQFHLTLKFLGDVDAGRVEELKTGLGAAVGGFGRFRLRAEGIGFFPNALRPRVVWGGVRGEGNFLARLQAKAEEACAPFSKESAPGNFTGHVTLGRVKGISRSEGEALAGVASGMTRRVFGEWTADHLALIRSELLAGGSQHSSLGTIPLTQS